MKTIRLTEDELATLIALTSSALAMHDVPKDHVEEVVTITRKLIDAMKTEPKSELRPLGEMVDEDIARAQALGVHVNDL